MKNDAEPENSDRWFKNPDWHIVWITVLLFAVGLYTAYVFHRQFTEMQTQTGILNTQAKQAAADAETAAKRVETQLAISERQAKAAQDSVAAVKRQMRQDQRAWIEVTSAVPAPQGLSVGMIPETEIIYVNHGKSPAKNIQLWAVVEKVKNGESPHFNYDACRPRLYHATGYLHTGRPITTQARLYHVWGQSKCEARSTLSKQDFDDFMLGKAYLATTVYMTYSDIFKVKHWLKYCAWTGYKRDDPALRYTASDCSSYDDEDNN